MVEVKQALKSNGRDLLLLIVLGIVGAIAFFPIFGAKLWGTHFARKIDYVKVYDQQVQANPTDLNAVYLRGLQRCNKEDYKGAIDDMSQCLQANPNRRDALAVRCKAYYKTKDYPKALDDINRVLFYERQDQDYWQMRADVYEAMGRKDLADKDYQTSLKFATPEKWKH